MLWGIGIAAGVWIICAIGVDQTRRELNGSRIHKLRREPRGMKH